ncbi:uncharacterized protein LOC133818962 [Humulus lupulus]|uniref:uncharacterized protein LOC133818962 n=1 Tax=Humulus lupulus TaxID=3486 RepID=UPI002B404AFD|nr:uncharacterized protein LOC133818962 [Humulus lupulus]
MELLLLLITMIIITPRTSGLIGVVNMREKLMNKNMTELQPEFLTKFYTQTLDHFNYKPESYATFQQRYIVNFKYWGGTNTSSPIFVYTGDEEPIINPVLGIGFMVDLASRFNGLLLYIEHRYYGESIPFGSLEEAYSNSSTLGYFSSAQALADYAELIIDLKKNLSAQNCPVIALGGSYGGMLASWFRLKYPHITIGALASSAPILYFDDITPQNTYQKIVTRDFRETSESCYFTIRQSWSEIDRVAAQVEGLQKLNDIFYSCRPFNSSQQLKDYLGLLYESAAQYDNPPSDPIGDVCRLIDEAPMGTGVLGRIAAVANAGVILPCHVAFQFLYNQQYNGWAWQTCSEMVMPVGSGANETMFEYSPFDLNNFTKNCQELFGVTPRPHWITTQFGGHMKWLIAQRDKEIRIIGFWIAEYKARLTSTTTSEP